MLQLNPQGPDLWDSVLPEELRKLPEELARVDELLRDERFMEPFLKRFNKTTGRPTVPVATYLRLMYIKFRYKLGYETLEEEVSDSIRWRRFCGIGYQQSVPDSSTLIKLTHKYGEDILKELHELIIKNLCERKLIRGRKVRMDTTVVAADIHYPTDSGLLCDGLRRIRQGLQKVPKIGLRIGRTLKKAKNILFGAVQSLRKPNAASRKRVKRANLRILKLTRKVVAKVKRVIHHIKDVRIRRCIKETINLTSRAAQQSEERLSGEKPKERIVSLADPEARPIVRGKLDKPVEFGRTAQITQDESGYFTQMDVHHGNPNEAPLLKDIIRAHNKQFPHALKQVAADTNYASEDNYSWLHKQGVSKVGIRWKGGRPPPKVLAAQKRVWFKKLKAYRAGIEGSISFLNRKFGLKRSLFRGTPGTHIWVSWVLLAANLYRFGRGP